MAFPSSGLLKTPALAPLRDGVYRGLWLAWLTANMTMWMHDVSAAWLMTQLTDSAAMVALVSSASTLPVFMLGVATMFSLLGASASALGRLLLQNQGLLLLIGGTLVMGFGVMALLGKGFTGMSQNSRRAVSATPGGSYLFGLTFSVGLALFPLLIMMISWVVMTVVKLF